MCIPWMFAELESHKIYVTFHHVWYLIIHISYPTYMTICYAANIHSNDHMTLEVR